MAKRFPLHAKSPERNGSGRTMPPCEMPGEDRYAWGDWGIEPDEIDPSAEEKAAGSSPGAAPLFSSPGAE